MLERSQELLCFFPEMLPLEAKLRHLSTCKAAMRFAQQFKPTQAGVPARTATIALKRRRIYLRELEPGIWAALVVVAAEVAARPPNDGQELSSSVTVRPSTPYAPATPAGATISLGSSPAGRAGGSRAASRRSRASDDSSSTRMSGSAVGSAAGAPGASGSDYVATASESEAQALIDTLYRRWTVLLGSLWACLGGEGGLRLLAAGTAAMARHRKCRDKLVRAHEQRRHSAAPPAGLSATISGLEADMAAARAEVARVAGTWPLLALRRRLQRVVTWALWHADVTRLSAIEARDGPVPCPMNPASFRVVSELVTSVHRCHTGIEHVIMLWDGKVVVGSRHQHARHILGVISWLAWDLLHGSPPLTASTGGGRAGHAGDGDDEFWSRAPATEPATEPASVGGTPGVDGFREWEEAMLVQQLGVPVSPEDGARGLSSGFSGAVRPSAARPLPLAEAAADVGCDRGFVGVRPDAALPCLSPVHPLWIAARSVFCAAPGEAGDAGARAGVGPAARAGAAPAPRVGFAEGTAAAEAESGGPDAPACATETEGVAAPTCGPLGPPLALLGTPGCAWSQSLEQAHPAAQARVVACCPRLLALPLVLGPARHAACASHRVLWMQQGRLSVLLLVAEESCQWSTLGGAAAVAAVRRLEDLMPARGLQLLCKRVASQVQTHLPAVSAALNDGVRVARLRAEAEPFMQRHADMGAVGVFGELSVPQRGAYRGVTTAEAARAMSLKGSLLASRAATAVGWRVPPPCASSGPWIAPSLQDAAAMDGTGGAATPWREKQTFASVLIADAVAASDADLAHAEAVVAEHEEAEASAAGDAGPQTRVGEGSVATGAGSSAMPLDATPSPEHRLREWAARRQHWALVSAAHWPSMGGGGAGEGSVDVPANYDSPDALVQAVERVAADARNATSVAFPVDAGVAAAMPVAHSAGERLDFTRRAGGAVARREGYRELTLVHARATPQIATVSKTAGALLGPRFRHLYV